MKKMLLIGVALWLGNPFAQAQTPKPKENTRAIVATDLTRIKQAGAVAVSPDGQRAVYTLTSIEPKDGEAFEYEYRTHLYLVELKPGAAPKALTRGSESARQPVWAPDGKSIAFVRSVKGKPQIFVMPLDGGEAWQLTTSKYGAGNPRWSPQGTRLVYSATLTLSEMLKDSVLNPGKRLPSWSLEKPGFSTNSFITPDKSVKPNPDGTLEEIRAYLNKDVEDKKAKVVNRLDFQGESTTEPEMEFSHLYVIEVREGATPKPLTRGFQLFQGAEWLNDNSLLAVTERDTLKHPDREQDNQIVWIAADGSGKRGTVLAEAGRSYFAPTLSPDGRQLALLTNTARNVGFPQLAVATLKGTTASAPQLIAFDRSAGNLTWAPAATANAGKEKKTAGASNALYFTAPSNGGFPLYRLDGATLQVTQLSDVNSGIGSFGVSKDKVVFAKTEVANPSEVFVAPISMTAATYASATKLTSHNNWVADKTLSSPEKRTYRNAKGQTVEYWIMKPAFAEAGKKYPLLLQMHGGPTAMWGPGEPSMWHEFQFFCSQGYGVVYANPRGSGGYGQAFQKANYQDWGTGPTEDVLAAATDAAKEAWADTSRQVITGGSYAGYLTAWIVAHDNRFKAAFAQRGVYDLTTFMGEGNAWRLVPNYFGGYPWQKDIQQVLDANSPLTFVDKIRTPLLIKHGENDLRTGVIQSEMLYKSLKVLERPVEYVRMPGGTHELSRSGNVRQRIDRTLRIYEFFERYVGQSSARLTEK